MPVTRSAKKALRQQLRRKFVNLRIKKGVEQALKTFRATPSQKSLSTVFSVLDRAVKKGAIPKRRAARLKSRLSVKVRAKPAAKKRLAKTSKRSAL